MKRKFFLLLILILNLPLKLFYLGQIPPLSDSRYLWLRLASSFLGIISPFLLYLFLKKGSPLKLALLSALFFSFLPSSLIESRIVSPVQIILFIMLLFMLIGKIFRSPHFHFFLIGIFIISLFSLYSIQLSFNHLFSNLLALLSLEMIFFRNISFYWGGIREYGFLYLSFLPFFFLGLFSPLLVRRIKIFFIPLTVAFLVSVSSTFPENRLIYLTSPFFSIIVAGGILAFLKNDKLPHNLITYLLLLFSVYELSQFLHHYYIHYPQDVASNFQKINYPF